MTSQRTYRFNTELFESVEEDCARHLANPKQAPEALILHWLEEDTKARGAIAMRHRQRIGLVIPGRIIPASASAPIITKTPPCGNVPLAASIV